MARNFTIVCSSLALVAAALVACAEDPSPAPAATPDGGSPRADAATEAPDAAAPVDRGATEGGFKVGPEGTVVPATAFATGVVSTAPGPCGGFAGAPLPEVVLGPPLGGGPDKGSLDVYSLGVGGSITLSFGDASGAHAIVDGPGDDFVVFENAFKVAGTDTVFAEPGEVAASEDGVTWVPLPCDPKAPYAGCAGKTPVLSAPGGPSPLGPEAGGDRFDLKDFGLTRARYLRITDRSATSCRAGSELTNAGFDLDGVAVLHGD